MLRGTFFQELPRPPMELDKPHRRIEVRLEYLKSALTLALSCKRARKNIYEIENELKVTG